MQEKLSSVENLPELKSAYSSISGENILRFKDFDAQNFSKFFYIFIDYKEDLQILCDLNLMIDYALECMIENNISKLDAVQKMQEITVNLMQNNKR
ncbi:hypothetical protein CAMRE0001_2203 [Campylobacter rectus RM3267]|uniref:Uncharacterized protein n=1 Tax=Campylobacter rectus RM3267 TaxID=553218 RepID=B9D642_CAMRE|nr:hypothetical protein [Campylobacter rectus]EEF12541.1 hypothetical protein CAMRE0001_2203 [Campylobacter rectus RM3267]RRD52044.1 hypothetical protein EII16_11540 [Campylobacter rectus]UEB48264.1 hypothetical protein LK437_02800 [Campylobacter rectus]